MKQQVLPQNAVEVRPDNPYDHIDRGLFMLRQVQTKDGLKQDVLARIGTVKVEAFQGEQTVSAVTYQVLIWDKAPTDEASYAKFTVFTDPVKNVNTFSFSVLVRDYDVFTLEAYCINHFLKIALNPERVVVEDMEARFRLFKSHENIPTYNTDLSLAVTHVRHVQKFTSKNGLPFKLEKSVMRYRGFPTVQIPSGEKMVKSVRLADWTYKDGVYIEVPHEVGSNRLMVGYALDHFAKPEVQEQAKSLLVIE